MCHLMKALPIIHFVRGDCKPHQQISFDPTHDSWVWEDKTLNTSVIQSVMTNRSGYVICSLINCFTSNTCFQHHSFIKEYIAELQMLFHLDPLIMPVLVYICPRDDLPLLCGHVPLSLIIGIVINNLEKTYNFDKREV